MAPPLLGGGVNSRLLADLIAQRTAKISPDELHPTGAVILVKVDGQVVTLEVCQDQFRMTPRARITRAELAVLLRNAAAESKNEGLARALEVSRAPCPSSRGDGDPPAGNRWRARGKQK